MAKSTACQGVYVATSTLALFLSIVALFGAIASDSQDGRVEEHNPVITWNNYIIQDWGRGTCSEGIRLDDIASCRTAFDAYRDVCETSDDGPQVENWDGQPGCHMQDAGFAEFQFNTNMDGKGAEDHAPVCRLPTSKPVRCYKESEGMAWLEAFGAIIGLLMWIPPIFMSVSRLCIPGCCCPGGMEDVPGCCPCTCFAQLDTMYYVVGGFAFFTGLMEWLVAGPEVNLSVIILLRPLIFGMLISVVATTSVKLGVMAGCCCQQCAPGKQVPAVPAHAGPVVIGQAVTVSPVKGQPEDNLEPTK